MKKPMFVEHFSGIKGYDVMVYKPTDPTEPSPMSEMNKETRHIIFTAETHNFPTGLNFAYIFSKTIFKENYKHSFPYCHSKFYAPS